ncbi:MAG: flagellar hook-basal body complex protein FliE [Chloroherpetonaceae bacterium]|nr:flagellar hook-basal body complex protein FliE [Chthonomonadaceae bacterium]MDW8208745.1 flagellar hook-basal body complex protein FliE [Chloroherpetonaceae bacterium]
MQIDPISTRLSPASVLRSGEGAALPLPTTDALSGATGAGKTFGQFLQDAIREVNEAQLRAADLTTRFATGEPLDVHQVMIASQEAGVMLDLAVQVRNKLLDAYQEILRVNL